MKACYKENQMLREKIMEWIGKTFGKPKHGDLFEFTYKVAEISKQGNKVLIEEMSFVFQRRQDDPGENTIKKWKRELEDITGTSLRAFHFGSEDLYGLATKADVKRGASAGDIVKGKMTMLNVGIFKEKIVAAELLIPSLRRH